MGQFIIKYAKGRGKTYELRLPIQLSRREAREVKDLRIKEVEFEGQVFKPAEQKIKAKGK